MFSNLSLETIIANIPALLIGLAFHECAHAWAADRLGDPTPRSQGRLSLNPLVHLDPIGTLACLLFRFGWAKPVMINVYNFKNPIRGRMLVSLAGPVTNLIIGLIATIIYFFAQIWLTASWGGTLNQILFAIIAVNLSLGVFNLLPIPPLDGFAILAGLLPQRLAIRLYALERYGMILLMLVLISNVAGTVLSPLVGLIWNVYQAIAVSLISLFI
ncbi:MAG: site-2 protease family protein [Peptococcaceae bacterium]|nr:site-2 protease family protein [Peptococcaceae bacterium]